MTARAVRGPSADVAGGGLIALMAMQFGAVVVLGKIATRSGLPVPSALAIRFLLAGALLGAVLAATGRPLRPARGEGAGLVVLGMVVYAAESALFFESLGHGSVPAATLLFFTYPAFVSAVAFLTGRELPRPLLAGALGAALAGAGVVALAGGRASITGLGVLYAMGAAITFSVYLLGADRVIRRTDPLAGAMWVSAAAGVGLTLYALLAGQARMPRGWTEWGAVLGMAAFSAGAFACLFAGLRRLGPVRTAVVSAAEPLAASALAVAFLGERLRAGVVLGGVLILAGAVAASLARAGAVGESPVP